MDVRAEVSAASQFGHIVGQSINVLGGTTATLWPFQHSGVPHGTPVRVSNIADNCKSVDVSNAQVNGLPVIALNCPNLLANPSAKVATYNGSSYVLKDLPKPIGATYCEVKGINTANQAAGTCYYGVAKARAAVFWPTFDAEPGTFIAPEKLASEAVFFNERGNVIINVINPQRTSLPIFWSGPSTVSIQIPTPASYTFCQPKGFTLDNPTDSRVIMTCASNNPDTPVAVFTWAPLEGLVTVNSLPGAANSLANAISPAGNIGVGFSRLNDGTLQAFQVPLP